MTRTVAYQLAQLIAARANCRRLMEDESAAPENRANAREWFDKHEARALQIAADFLPSGSGFDNGTSIDLDESTADRLVLRTSFHHMDQHGYYDGWTEHTIRVRPDWSGVKLTIGGRDRNGIKDYIAEAFDFELTRELAYDKASDRYVEVSR